MRTIKYLILVQMYDLKLHNDHFHIYMRHVTLGRDIIMQCKTRRYPMTAVNQLELLRFRVDIHNC